MVSSWSSGPARSRELGFVQGLADANVTAQQAQKRAGHASLDAHERYLRSSKGVLKIPERALPARKAELLSTLDSASRSQLRDLNSRPAVYEHRYPRGPGQYTGQHRFCSFLLCRCGAGRSRFCRCACCPIDDYSPRDFLSSANVARRTGSVAISFGRPANSFA